MGVWGAIVVGIGGVFWTITAASMGAPAIFPVFGVLFVITAVIMGVYNYRNATGKQRYSAFDITEDSEEPDPLNERFGEPGAPRGEARGEISGSFCPYCGAPAEADYQFCRRCGRKLHE
jgi:hypothetical protein